ncbi:MAG TPA: DNA-directed RNA polymerase subunit alpha C-terminal domain-containing protein [Planctomycetota bacterium]|nr:DNA-directed RNA polymerase subunit alpha C-terminal domain-containing protein [Planctomycetota bacterium]
MTTPTTTEASETISEAQEPSFDLRKAAIPSFGALQQARAQVFASRRGRDAFAREVESLTASGEEGRRKGLGLWMIGEYAAAAEQLVQYGSDDVASFTRANALMSAGQPKDALPIFKRLSEAYPNEPRPRGAMLEARLEADLLTSAGDDANEKLKKGLAEAPASFEESCEGNYLAGRVAEFERRYGTALDHYEAAYQADPTHRGLLFRAAHLFERCGEDQTALRFYQSLAQLLPIDRNVLFNLGMLYEDMGRDRQAASCYEVLVRNDPTDRRARLYFEDARSALSMYYDEDLERKEDRLNAILRTPISDFELSVRARNCLNKMNIITLGDLVRQTETELLAYKNFGETSLNEIKEILSSKNLRLGMAHEEAVASIEAAARPRISGENSELMNRPISDLDLSIRARRTVELLGCLTLGDVVQHSEEELLGMPNFGVTSLTELKRKLTELGLKLADSPPPKK